MIGGTQCIRKKTIAARNKNPSSRFRRSTAQRWQRRVFRGSNGVFYEQLSAAYPIPLNSRCLKQAMNRYRWQLEDRGVVFRSYRTSSMRLIKVAYVAEKDMSNRSDTEAMTQE